MIARRIVAPLLLILVPTIGAMGYYNWRVTGNPLRTPYLVMLETYNPVPHFPWQAVKAIPEYHHQVMKDYYVSYELSKYGFAREHPGKLAWDKAGRLISFFLGPIWLMPVVALLLVQRSQFFRGLAKPSKARTLLLLCALPLVGLALPIYFNPYFAAPITAAVFALPLMAMRYLRLWQWRSQPAGRQLVRMVPALAVAIWVLHTSAYIGRGGLAGPSWDSGQSAIRAELRGYPGGQLVIVQYEPNHMMHDEWVFNDADIDAAKVVWARDMGASANQELLRYFKDRRVWRLEADDSPPKLLPYVAKEGTGTGSGGR